MKAEHTLDALLDSYAFSVRSYALAPDADAAARMDDARALLLSHLDAAYVRRDSVNHYAYLDRMTTALETRMRRAATRPPASPPGSYKAARGILPWKPGDELPEERIRRLRDDDRQRTLHLDDAGQVVSGAPDFEGDDGD